MAKSAMTAEEEQNKLKTAKIMNIIGTIGGVLSILFAIIYVVIIAAAVGGAAYYY